jgi:SpoVK/Ycf46/Vps4 family AAA+-type ATPase
VIRPVIGGYKDRVTGYDFVDFPKTNRDQIVFDDSVWELLDRNLFMFHSKREELKKGKISLKRGILLAGDPGTGKTLLCQHIINSFTGYSALYVPTVATDSISAIVGMAKQLQPAIVVLEDIDLAAGDRKENRAKAVLGELMNQMEGLSTADDLVFLCTTNHLAGIEPAIIARPGRIDQILVLPNPGAEIRRRLFGLYTDGIVVEADLDRWVSQTDGFTPAAIKELVKKASSVALLDKSQKSGKIHVKGVHLESALRDLVGQMEMIKALQQQTADRKQPKAN